MDKAKIIKRIREYIDSFTFELGEYGIASHPLFTSFATIDMDEKDESKRLVKITDDNFERLKEQRYKFLERQLQKAEDDLVCLFIHIHKPYCIPILICIADELTNKEFSETLIDLWVDTEFPNQNGVRLMVSLFERADKKYLMSKEERKIYDALDDFVVVYRGIQADAHVKALSWTLSKEKAIWFANRWSNKGKVYKAKIQKKYIFAFKDDRNEKEIILNPDYLKNIKEVQY